MEQGKVVVKEKNDSKMLKEIPCIRGVVFDLDGVLVNTELVFQQVGNELARRRGKEMTLEVFKQMMGRRPREAFTVMIELLELHDDTPEELQKESQQLFFELLETLLEPMPGLLDLLETIERAGLPKAVATSSPRDYARRILEKVELVHRFRFILGAEDVSHGKPHPEIYLKSAERLGIAPTEMLVVEDSEHGTKAAAASGAFVVAVPHQFSQHHDFSPADYVAQALNDPVVLQIIEQQAASEPERPCR